MRVERADLPIQRRTLIDVLEPRLMFSAEHPLGLAVGPADFQEHFEHLRDAERAAVTLSMLHELERESSENQFGSANRSNDTREAVDTSLESHAIGDAWHESTITEFRANNLFDAGPMLNDGINPVIIDVTTELDRIDATDMSSLLAFNNGAGGDGLVSLREAITVANADPTVDVIRLPDGNYRLTLDTNNWNEDANLEGDLDIEGSYIIQGESEANTIIGQDVGNRRVFEVRSGPVTFADLTISDGSLALKEDGSGESIPGAGVLVQTGDTAIFTNVTFINNDSIGDGGALWVDGNATLNNVSISGSDTERGAGIFGDVNSTVVIRDSSISNNNAGDDGGGIFIEGSLAVYDSVLDGNAVNAANASDDARGGAIWIGPDADVTIQDTVLSNNWAKSDGGAIDNSGQLTLIDSDLIQNDTEGTGGALRNAGDAALERVTVYGNTVLGNGVFDSGAGIINTVTGDLTITYSIVAANTSQSYAGGLSLLGTGVISDSIIINNVSQVADGGGGVLDAGSSVRLTNTVVANNIAAGISNDVQGFVFDLGFGAVTNTVNSGGFNLVETAANFDAVPTDIVGIDSGFTLSGLDGNNDAVISVASTSAAINSGSSAGVGNTTIFGTVVGDTPNIGGHTSSAPSGMIFWSSGVGSIFRSDTDFTYSQNVIDGISAPLDIDVDDVNHRVYWLDPDDYEIKSAKFDGTDIVTERRVNEDAVAFDFDRENERFFVAAEDGSSSSILQYFKSDTYNTEAEEREGALIQSITGEPVDIELDQGSNILYWAEETGGTEDIMSVETRPLGENPQVPVPQIVANGDSLVKDPYALTLNESADQVFWSERALGFVARYTDVNGSETLAVSEPQALAYDTFNDRLLVADNSKNIYAINSTFDTVSALVSVPEKVWDLKFALIQADEPEPNQVPVITSVSNISAAENQSSVLTVTSTDGDSDTPTYTINGGTDDGLFTIDSSSGELTFKTAPNFEVPGDAGSDNTYDVVVQVDDGNGGTNSQSLEVTVINVDENPMMTPTAATSVVENQTSVLTVDSTDVDGGVPAYTISGGADAAIFAVDGASGILTFLAAPNFEAANDADSDNVYEVTVQVADADGDTATQSISVTVTNEDENPVMTPTVATIVVENQTSVLTVNSTDVDGGVPAYTISGGADAVLFAVDGTSGILTFLAAPNFEAPNDADVDNVYEVTVQVADADGDTATQSIRVTVTNEDENPVMTPTVATIVVENQTSVLTVNSTDVDGGVPAYTISGGADAALFAVDGASGILTFLAAPNFEAPNDADVDNVYEVTVQVADADGDIATQSIRVTVTNEDENPVMTPTVATSVVENQTSVLTVDSTDVDGGVPAYTISGGADAALFAVDGTSGILTFLAAPNFEAANDADGDNVYEVAVQVADADGDTATQNITVTVTNEDENPVMTPTVATDVVENQTSVLTVNSTDVDGGVPAYTISGGADAALFAVDGTSGIMTFLAAPNFEAPNDADVDNVYEVMVQVADADGDTATQSIAVTVTNEDEIPVITSTATTNVVENQTNVLTVSSSDVDGGAPAYTISGGADAALFDIDGASGVLTFLVSPNFEAPDDTDGDNIYQVIVQVSDSDNTATTQAITVTVTNDDEVPVISTDTNTIVVENQNSVLTVGSSNVDGGVPRYFISGGADADIFAMDVINGTLTFQLAPNFENPADNNADNVYELTVQVEDSDGDTATRMISVTVNNVNEDPSITSVSNLSAAENQNDVLSVTSVDEDGDPALFSISGGVDADNFDIDSLSGALSFKIQPDFESPRSADESNSYDVTIEVSDGNGGLSTQAITVNVLDENDAPIVNRQLSSQILDIDSVLSVGGDSFSDQDSDDLVYSMTLIDGRPLPTWISFNPDTTDLRLGVPPSESVTEQLLLIAEDSRGGTAQMNFDVRYIEAIEEIEPTLQAAAPTIPDSTSILIPEITKLNPTISLPTNTKQPSAVSENGYSTSVLGLASEDSIDALASVSAETMSGLMSNGFSSIVGRGDSDADQRAVLRNNILSEYLAGQAAERTIAPDAYVITNVFDDSVNIANLFAMAQLQDPEMYTSLSDGFDKQREEIDTQINASRGVIGSAITTTSGLSIGYILYLLRGGAIMSSMLTSLPAWRFVDPLPILGSLADSVDSDGESLQSIVGGSEGAP